MSQSGLVDIESSNPQVPTQFNADSGSAVPLSNVLEVEGNTVANATYSQPLWTVGSGNTVTAHVQVGAAVTGAPGDTNDAGIVSFDDTEFSVDADGYVTLIGGGPAIDTVTGDDAVAVSSDGAGNINFEGVTVSNATNAKPLYIDGDAVSFTQSFEIQVGAAVTGAPADKNDAGIVSFDDTAFAVSADGYVTFAGSGAATTLTGDTGGAISPVANNFNVLGGTGASTTGAGSTLTIDVAGGGVTWTVVTGATQALAVNNGYIGNRATSITYTLPDTAAVGSVVKITNIGAGLTVIAQNAGESINFTASTTTVGVGGSLTAIEQFASIELVNVVADTTWNVLSATGNWSLV